MSVGARAAQNYEAWEPTMPGSKNRPRQRVPLRWQGGDFFGRGYLVMAIYPLTMAGLVPLPNQSTDVFRRQFFGLGIVDSKFYLRSFETHVLARAHQQTPR